MERSLELTEQDEPLALVLGQRARLKEAICDNGRLQDGSDQRRGRRSGQLAIKRAGEVIPPTARRSSGIRVWAHLKVGSGALNECLGHAGAGDGGCRRQGEEPLGSAGCSRPTRSLSLRNSRRLCRTRASTSSCAAFIDTGRAECALGLPSVAPSNQKSRGGRGEKRKCTDSGASQPQSAARGAASPGSTSCS